MGETQLVEEGMRTVVEIDVLAVPLRRAVVASHGVADVAEQLVRARRRRVERDGCAEVPRGGFQFSPPPVCLATLEIGRHRLRLQPDGAAEGLDGPDEILARRSRVTHDQELAIFRLPAAHDISVSAGQNNRAHRGREQQTPHGA